MRSISLAVLLLLVNPVNYLIPPGIALIILCRIAYHLQ